MMKLRRSTKIIFKLLCSFGLTDQSYAESYVVRQGDNLSKILYDNNIRPIYGKNGKLLKVIECNARLKKSKGNAIYPGMELYFFECLKEGGRLSEMSISSLTKQQEIVENRALYDSQIDENKIANGSIISRSDLALSALSEFSKVESTDLSSGAKATFISSASIGFKLSWGQSWSNYFRSILSFQSAKVNIQDSSSGSKALINKSNTFTKYLFDTSFKYSSSINFINSISYEEVLVSRSIDSMTIKIEKISTPLIFAGLEYKAYQIDDLDIKGSVSLGAILPSKQESYNSKLSFSKKVGVRISDSLGSFKIRGEFYYQNTNLKMTNVKYDQSNVGIMVGVKKEFGIFE